jgi:Fe-S oxidoreductase
MQTREEFLYIGDGKYLFYFLIYLSLAIMAGQIIFRIRAWKQGRPVDWAQSPGKWLGNIWQYVLLQRKVRTSRRKSGAPMHVMIFYGFLAMFLATTLLAAASYAPWIGIQNWHRGTYFLAYESVFDLLGLLLLFGLIWALVRRPKIKRFATTDWKDYATLWLLLIITVTGYWLEASRIGIRPQDGDQASQVGYSLAQILPTPSIAMHQFTWWFHMSWIFIFFATLPQMRIRHIVMAVASTAGKPDQPWGELRTISMEEVEQTEQIGVKLAKDYSRWHLMSLDACMECGRCTEVCPANRVGKILNPKQVVQDIRAAMVDGREVAQAVTEEALWQCTTCNACVEACPVLIRHVDMIVDARRFLVAEGRLSGTAATMLRQVASTSHAWGQPAEDREKWMEGMDIPLCRDSVEFEYLFWVGCAGATDPGAMKTTKSVASLLKKAGVKFACLGREEACTGDPARRVGEEFLFQEKAIGNVATFERYGVKKVVTACPHCMNTFKNEYGQFEGKLEVYHHTQLLQQLISKGALMAAKPNRAGVTLHDPCNLGRVNNEADAPRALLGAITDLNSIPHVPSPESSPLNEPPHYGRKTLCCGAGGGRMWMEEPPEQRPATRRAQELVNTGADTVALACPFCRIMLDASIKQVTEKEIRLVDLAEMLDEANPSATP